MIFRRIEEFIDDRFDIIFYNRFFNTEVTAGSYLVKNTAWSRTFLEGWAMFGSPRYLPKMSGSDNGAIHAYLMLVMYPHQPEIYSKCLRMYYIATNREELYASEACIRSILGVSTELGKIKILRKGSAWARDNWLTNSKWNPDGDFMMHAWKQEKLTSYTPDQLPLTLKTSRRTAWFNPLAGPIDLEKCTPENSTWAYDTELITTTKDMNEQMMKNYVEAEETKLKLFKLLAQRLNFQKCLFVLYNVC